VLGRGTVLSSGTALRDGGGAVAGYAWLGYARLARGGAARTSRRPWRSRTFHNISVP